MALPILVACGGNEAAPAAREDQNASASAAASASPTATGATSEEGQEKDSTDQPSPVSATDYPDQLSADSAESQSLDQALAAVDAARAAQPVQKPSASPASEGEEPTGVEVDTTELEKHFADAALEEVSAELGEMGVNGWHVSGSPAVVGQPRARSASHDGQAAREVSVCLDSSQVSVTDDQGRPVEAGTTRDRVMNLYTLVQKDGAWVVVDHSFPQNTSC